MPHNLDDPNCLMEDMLEAPQFDDVFRTAKDELINVIAKTFKRRISFGRWANDDGVEMSDYLANLADHHPHYRPNTETSSLLEDAFVHGNLTARGKVMTQEGPEKFKLLAEMWQASPTDPRVVGVAPGIREALGPDAVEKRREEDRKNPWSEISWNITRQGEIVRTMGLDAAARFARSAGSKIGATRPTPKK